ncbi:MAG: muconolactone Delta-isomerase family protein [Anaerolineae bacterium]
MRFLVESMLNQVPTPEILALIPAESARGVELDGQGIREKLYIAADQPRSWQVFTVPSQAALDEVLASFPLHPYVHETVTPLAENAA